MGLAEQVHNALNDNCDNTVIMGGDNGLCPHHPAMERRVATIAVTSSFIATGIDDMRIDMLSMHKKLDNAIAANAIQTTDITIVQERIASEMKGKAAIYAAAAAIGSSMFTGLVLIIVEKLSG